MAASYPTASKSFSTKATTNVIEAAHVNDIQDEVTAIETALLGTLAHDVKVASGKYFFGAGRSVADGVWTTPAFSASDFTGNGSMTWTVASGDVGTYAYTLHGKTMTVVFAINTSTVGGTPSSALRIAIPGGYTAAKEATTPILVIDNSLREIGLANVAAAGSVINCLLLDLSNWAAATDATSVQGQITFEVQ